MSTYGPSRLGAPLVATLLLVLFGPLLSGPMRAQTAPAPAPQPARAVRTPDRLPVRRVVLYKNGIGYFEHLGKVRGNQTVTIDFTSGQLDDALKSLTTLDLDGGRVSGVSYNSEAALDRQLGTLRLPLGQQATRAQLLNALRGARLDVGGASHVTGRLLSVETVEQRGANGTVTSVDTISIVTDAGEIQTVALTPGVPIRIADADLTQEVGRYLSLVASQRDQDTRRLTISATGTGERDLFVSYVSEVPVWKATYRLVLPSAGETRRPLLQGWAVVDNTVGEDWENVELSLVAGAPQSFVQAISRPLYVQRPVVAFPDRMLTTPQTHQGALGTAGPGVIAGTVTDSQGGVLPGATVQVMRGATRVGGGVTDASGRFRVPGLAGGSYDVRVSVPGFRDGTRSGVAVSGGMESVLSIALDVGGATEAITVTSGLPAAGGGRGGRGAGQGVGGGGGAGGGFGAGAFRSSGAESNIMMDGISAVGDRVDAARQLEQAQAAAGQLGDLFEYKLREPVTIRKNQSALVPILSGDVTADKVSLWNPASGSPRPLRAVWLTNSTGLTLDGGSFTIVEGQAFAGEGLIDPLKAGEKRLLSYALDLGLQVDAKMDPLVTHTSRVQISRGVLVQQNEQRQRMTYTVRNEDTEARTLVIEHPVRAGWTVGGTLTPSETTAAWNRFRVPVAAKTTATFVVEETRPLQTQVQITNLNDQQVAILVRDTTITPAMEAALREVLTRKAAIAQLATNAADRQREIDEIGRDQTRVRENLQALKGSAEEKQLVQRYVKQLDDQETRLQTLRKELQSIQSDRQKAEADLARYIEGLSLSS